MPIQTVATRFGEMRLAGAANGVSLSTSAAYTSFPPNTQWVSITPRNFSTAVVARYAWMPYLTILKNTDNLATEPIDCSYAMQDGDVASNVLLNLNSFSTLANGDAIYVGCHIPFRALHVDVQAVNGTSNDIAVAYSTSGLATLTVTDNTDTGASLAADGTITWTVPTDWEARAFNDVFSARFRSQLYTDRLYWLRLSWSAAMDSATTVNQIRGLGRSATYAELVSGQTLENSVKWGYGGFAGIEALTDAGTANLVIQVATLGKARFGALASGSNL